MLYIARCTFELASPLHIGGEGDGLLDAPVTRDAFGLWRILGSSIVGVLRSHADACLGESMSQELFGVHNNTGGSASKMWCSDAVLLDFDGHAAWKGYIEGKRELMEAPSFVRDHVCIDNECGAAKNGGKYDEEYVPAGTRFSMELSLDGWMQRLDEALVRGFGHLLAMLQDGTIRFGAKEGNGYGHINVLSLDCRHFDLHHEGSLSSWLRMQDFTNSAGALAKDVGEPWIPRYDEQYIRSKQGLSGTLRIPLMTKGPLLIGGGPATDDADADMCFATTAYCDYKRKVFQQKYVIPGSALKGILRHQVYDIAKVLKLSHETIDIIIKGLFGTIEGKACKGKVSCMDAEIQSNKACKVVQHVSIDRFTGGAVDVCLFNEAPLWNDAMHFACEMRLNNFTALEAALFLQAMMDLAEGRLAIGSGVNRGNGRLYWNKEALDFSLNWKGEHISPSNMQPLNAWLQKLENSLHDAVQGGDHA